MRNLYKLVTISPALLNGRPLFPKVIRSTGWLILGSACEAGELYRAMMAGASEEVLEEIASFYDYLKSTYGQQHVLVHKNLHR